ncbi:MAG: hypothetical protein HOC23_08775 [Halieaceae bacterium]|nr:hypothetical protein [Halieaceae bacterium]
MSKTANLYSLPIEPNSFLGQATLGQAILGQAILGLAIRGHSGFKMTRAYNPAILEVRSVKMV